ncbi:ferrous iron transporter B [Collinsella sp. OM06-18AC]|uniref:ferrous iron transporter B n=1 Tax=Collinsella sp. OM06-18AC TaxID=2292327 RepID=UPI000E44C643|nr:ferrous iron transporter B [Collinsella sp. OM06-18AC]RGM94357.1 ferrous iron transporter B [Collinsella sp. OM06-18AC]
MADSQIHVALAGNPNCGKTTLFNLITGANGYVGNWPGVTVEKKEAKLLSDKNVTITDLPGIYSLSPYSPEEQCSRDYLMSGEPDVVVQVVDATNLERNLYLALQVIETGLPVVVALNMADLVEKNGDKIDTDKLSKKLGCPVMMISALKNKGITELFEQVKKSAASKGQVPEHKFDSSIEDVLDHIENNLPASVPANKRRYYAVKLFERDADACKLINLTKEKAARVEQLVAQCEQDCDDDAESIITGERYGVIAHIIDECMTKAPAKMSTSEKIDRVVTNRILGLPIFVVIMFCVYYIAVSTLGGTVTDFTNDQLFGTDGWYVLGQGRDAYDAAVEAAGDNADSVDPAQYGPYVPGITTAVHDALVAGGTEDGGLVDSLVCDGIVAGIGAIMGFVPQMFLLFVMLSFLEDCGYMARVAFIMDRVFRRFGLSGKSFIPMLVSSGCGVPGVMATKTIENEKDRRMTVMTTTFIPCGAKLPIIALLMGSIIGDSSTTAAWISPLFYFLGVFAVIASGLMLKKTKLFAGRPTPFVMELPAYHFPAIRSWALHVWERCFAFIKKAGTVIFASTVVVWFLSNFGSYNGAFGYLPSMEGIPEEFMDYSVLAMFGNLVAWIFAPLGFSTWQATALTVSGLVAKENVVATAGSLLSVADAGETDPSLWTAFAAMFPTMGACVAFGAFNLLCAPCFAAIGTIRNQMNSGKWTAIAIGYECAFAWVIGLFINQFYNLLVLGQFGIWTVVAIVLLAAMLFQIFRPMPKHAWTDEDETNTASATVSA